MSVTIGFLHKNGRPAEQETLEILKKAYREVPYDSYSFISDGSFALGHINIDILTENPIEKQPLRSESGRYIASGRIRIDNRSDLITALSLHSKTDINTLSDTRLFLHAYEKWEEASFDKILGEFAVVIWDQHEENIIIAKDIEGHYPLYYYETDQSFYFASTIKAFFELPGFIKEVNYKKLVERMLPFPANSIPEETNYKNINGFKQNHFYKINENGIQTSERHWFPEHLSPIKYKGLNDYIEHFNEIYEDAVIKRLSKKGQTASFLSGGLDSSSVTVIANDYLQQSGRKIYSYSSVPQYPDKMPDRPNSFSDETPLIQKIIEQYPAIIHRFVKSPDFSPLDAIDYDLKVNKMYTSNFQNGYWYRKILELAKQDGVNVIMTGQAGNLTISRTGADLFAQLLRNFDLSNLLKEMKAEANIRNSKISWIALATFYNLLKKQIYHWFPAMNNPSLRVSHLIPFSNHTINQYHIPEEYKRLLRNKQQTKFTNGIPNTFVNKLILNRHITSSLNLSNPDDHLMHPIESRDATGDKRIHEFTKQISARVFRNNGIQRFLIRESMKGRLPEEVRMNPLRGKQAKDLSYRVKLDIQKYRDIIYHFEHDLIKFDKEKIKQVIKDIEEENITQDLFAKTTKLILQPVATVRFIKMLEDK